MSTTMNPHAVRFTVDPGELVFHGASLVRPECVVATRSGDLYAADWRGGVSRTSLSGKVELYLGAMPQDAESAPPRVARPNGIALRKDGSSLFADLGETKGGVFSLTRQGDIRNFLSTVNGLDLPPSNFVMEDGCGRTWITVSTRQVPRALGYTRKVADGFIVVVDGKDARIVADGLGYTNEIGLSPDGRWLYVNETFHRKLSRFAVRADGSLSGYEVVTEFGPGQFPDGLAFDDGGGVWIACIIGNQVIRVAPDGEQAVILADTDIGYIDWVEQAYTASTLGRAHLDKPHQMRLKNLSSIAFGGADLRTAYLGSVLGDAIASFRIPDHVDLRGHAPSHWDY